MKSGVHTGYRMLDVLPIQGNLCACGAKVSAKYRTCKHCARIQLAMPGHQSVMSHAEMMAAMKQKQKAAHEQYLKEREASKRKGYYQCTYERAV